MKFKCQECKNERYDRDFYRVIKQKINDEGKYLSCIICKDCIKKEYLSECQKVNNDFKQALLIMCEKYNIYYDESLMQSIKDNNIEDAWNLFQIYIKYISELIQYNGLKYKDSVFENKTDNKYSNAIKKNLEHKTLEDGVFTITNPFEEKSDIDFVNDDIRELKIKISKALQKEDFNAHNKWMNSLRDALELRDKLQKSKNDFNISIGNIQANDFNEIMETLKRYQISK